MCEPIIHLEPYCSSDSEQQSLNLSARTGSALYMFNVNMQLQGLLHVHAPKEYQHPMLLFIIDVKLSSLACICLCSSVTENLLFSTID